MLGMVAAVSLIWLTPELPPWHWTASGQPTLTVPGPPAALTPYPTFLHGLFFASPWVYSAILALIVTAAVVFWAELALWISAWTTNLYVVVGGPWLLYVLSSFVIGGAMGLGNWMPMVLSGPFVGGPGPGDQWVLLIWPLGVCLVVSGFLLTVLQKERDLLG
ncbi:MAG: hypothetical protein K6V97_14955 [Actinomycetia bacterium]|nr:hypothetical protein [Actinomycetes bacterium]